MDVAPLSQSSCKPRGATTVPRNLEDAESRSLVHSLVG